MNKTKMIQLTHHSSICPIHIGPGLLETTTLIHYCYNLANHLIVISDHIVAKLYAESLYQKLIVNHAKCHLFTFPAGEQSKTREVKQTLEDQILALGCGKDTAIIAVGGGVVTDLTGFIAATYCRGIRIVYIATTLMGMVDAAIGGKTAVNTPQGKNLIGSFYQPSALFFDTNTLKTLSKKHMLDGLVEMLKHAFIADTTFLKQLDYFLDHQNKKELLPELIYRSCEIKCEIVQQDETEKNGKRQILNFGHTMAHALEKIFQYKISHGQAVLAGLWIESQLSHVCGYLDDITLKNIKTILEKIQFSQPLLLKQYQLAPLKKAMSLDKKAIDQEARFVLIQAIGQVKSHKNQYSFPVSTQQLDQALSAYLTEMR